MENLMYRGRKYTLKHLKKGVFTDSQTTLTFEIRSYTKLPQKFSLETKKYFWMENICERSLFLASLQATELISTLLEIKNFRTGFPNCWLEFKSEIN